ncbi:hypothetical protein ATN79_48370 [Paraburkholderia caribensis]|nr:hypothetical protein ATN79_48370 [Paraburkholderia caribensis]
MGAIAYAQRLTERAGIVLEVFFERFTRVTGVARMAHPFSWRMALAKNMLRRSGCNVTEIAKRVGYRSASAFSVAFTRHVGLSPARYFGLSSAMSLRSAQA